MKVTQLCPTLCDPMDCGPPDSVHGDSPGNTGVGCHALFQGSYGQWASISITPLWPARSVSVHVWLGALLTLRMRNTWYDRAQSLSLIVLLFSSWNFSPWEMNLQLLYPQKWEKRQLNPSSIWQDCQRVTEFHIIRLDNGSIRGKLWAKLGNVGIGWAKRIN